VLLNEGDRLFVDLSRPRQFDRLRTREAEQSEHFRRRFLAAAKQSSASIVDRPVITPMKDAYRCGDRTDLSTF
jgi:hypothetical protein